MVDVDPGRPLHLYHFASAKSHSAYHGLFRSLKIGKLHNFVKSFYVEFEYSLHNPTYVMLVTLVTFGMFSLVDALKKRTSKIWLGVEVRKLSFF